MHAPPSEVKLRKASRVLEVCYGDERFSLPFEYLRIASPSAEVRGHGPGQEVLQTGKEEVGIARIEPVGHYAIRIVFDDGHDSGLYTWQYLRELGVEQDSRWANYLDRLAAAGYARNPRRTKPGEPE